MLENVLEYAAHQADVDVRVTSGGQKYVPGGAGKSIKGVRTGSHRHDIRPGQMGAADLVLLDRVTGAQLDLTKPADASRMGIFTEAAVAAGATGVGAGVGYMGKHVIHIGAGGSGTWGAGKGQKIASFIPSAHSRGMARFKTGEEVKRAQQGLFHDVVISSDFVEHEPKRATIKRNAKGADVRILQAALDIKVDGMFGKGTEDAVKTFQRLQGLKADGVVGPMTWQALGV
jgi:hypothetical protein